MVSLKEDTKTIGLIKSKLASITSELQNIDKDKAKEFSSWLLSKSKYYKQHHFKEKFPPMPFPRIKRGDVIWVDFGINIGDEFSDNNTDGHFAVVWKQQGFLFVVIPISKQENKNDLTAELDEINGLPEKINNAKIDNIRAISIRRIRRVSWLESGKATLTIDQITKIKKIFQEHFLDD